MLEMGAAQDLTQSQRQEMKVWPRLIQANEVLQLSSQDLEQLIAKELDENPALELVEAHRCDVCGTEEARQMLVRVATRLNDQELTTYTADGVLVATPTGSTAYSHAAGGPILHPEVHSLILTPICAHPTTSGSIVVPANTVVELTARTDHEAALSIDGQEDMPMRDGDVAMMSTSPHVARFLRNQKRDYFYETLLRKLRLS